jgi:rhamnosyltransferase
MERKIGGCVILYNPDASVVSNIATYCHALDVLYVIDNSPTQVMEQVGRITALSGRIRYAWMGENIGLAAALNRAGRLAVDEGCGWLLTMDQDSRFSGREPDDLIAGIGPLESRFGNIGIIGPLHLVSDHFALQPEERYTEIRYTMTSGNLLNLAAAGVTGPFEEKLFIDCVDMDYCLRLRKAGFRIVQDNRVRLQHSLGDFDTRSILGLKVGLSNHNPVRRYYITRNKIYVLANYFWFDTRFCWLVIRSMVGDTLRIIFFEKHKWEKLGAIFTGLRDALIHRYGKYAGKEDPKPGTEIV